MKLILLILLILNLSSASYLPYDNNLDTETTSHFDSENFLTIQFNKIEEQYNLSKNDVKKDFENIKNQFTNQTYWGKDIGTLCNKFTVNGRKISDLTAELYNINFETGDYICKYYRSDDDVIPYKIFNGKIKTIESLNEYAKSNKIIINDDYEFPNLVQTDSTMEVSEKSAKMGLWHSSELITGDGNQYFDEYKENKNSRITFMRTLTGIITLNNNYVNGITRDGKIIYTKDVLNSTKISTLDNSADILSLPKISTYLHDLKNNFTDNNKQYSSELEYSEGYSFLDYFDKNILGYYYLLEKFSFSDLLQNASLIILMISVAYLIPILIVKVIIAKSQGKNNIDFDFNQKIVIFGGVFLISFVPFIVDDKRSTSIAKEAISTLSDFGVKLTDKIADNGSIIYLSYLTNKVKMSGYDIIDYKKQQFSKKVMQNEIQTAFYTTQCRSAYKNFLIDKNIVYDDYKSWYYNISKDWKNTQSNYLFENSFLETKLNASFCNNLRKDIIYANTNLKKEYQDLSANLNNYLDGKNTNFDTLVNASLIGLQQYGFLSVATMPILHLFSQYTGAFENREESIEKMKEFNEAIVQTNMETQHKTTVSDDISQIATNITVSMLPIQSSVYFMMPAFNDIYNFSKKIVGFSVAATSSVIDFISPSSRFAPVLNMKNKIKKMSLRAGEKTSAGIEEFLVFILSVKLAIVLYSFLIQVFLVSIIVIFIIAKVLFWLIDILKYRYVSSFITFYALTIQKDISKINDYVTKGIILLIAKPILMISSFLLFIFIYELMFFLYNMILNYFIYILNTANSSMENNDFMGTLFLDTMTSGGAILIHFFGIYLAYIIILDGDNWFLKQLGIGNNSGQDFRTLTDKIDRTIGK